MPGLGGEHLGCQAEQPKFEAPNPGQEMPEESQKEDGARKGFAAAERFGIQAVTPKAFLDVIGG